MRPLIAPAVMLVLAGALGACGEDSTPAPATKKALAAVAVDVLDIKPSSYELTPGWTHPTPLQVALRWHPGGGHEAHRLELDARRTPEAPSCRDFAQESCDAWHQDGATVVLLWQEEQPEEDPGVVSLLRWRDGELHSLGYSGQQIVGDPRRQDDLPVSVDDLLGVLTDSRFGVTSTRAMVDADLRKWPNDDAAGEVVPASPRSMARTLQDGLSGRYRARPVDTRAWGAGADGVVVTWRNRELTVIQVPVGSARVPTCAAGWHCTEKRRDPGVMTGWQRGRATAVWTDRVGGVVVQATVADARITRDPRRRWADSGKPGYEVASLAGWQSWWGRYALKQEVAQPMPWFHD